VYKCTCSASKVDKCDEKLQSARTTDDQTLAAVTDDVNACHLETEHVHKVCNRCVYLTKALSAFLRITFLVLCVSYCF